MRTPRLDIAAALAGVSVGIVFAVAACSSDGNGAAPALDGSVEELDDAASWPADDAARDAATRGDGAADGAIRVIDGGADPGPTGPSCARSSDDKCYCSTATHGDASCDPIDFSGNAVCCAAPSYPNSGACTCNAWGCTKAAPSNGSCSCGLIGPSSAANLTEDLCVPPTGRCCLHGNNFCECRYDGLCPSGTPVDVCDISVVSCSGSTRQVDSCSDGVPTGGTGDDDGPTPACTEPGWTSATNRQAPHGMPTVPPACSGTSDCCQGALCVSGILNPDTQGFCVPRCANNSDCSTNCCAATSGGDRVCVGPDHCP